MQGRRGPITHCALGYLPVCCVCLPACQTAAALSNVKGALGGAGTDVKHLVKLTVYIVGERPPLEWSQVCSRPERPQARLAAGKGHWRPWRPGGRPAGAQPDLKALA